MKSYSKASGWLVRCIGGGMDGTFVRSWALTGDPFLEAQSLQPSFDVTVIPDHTDNRTWAVDTCGRYELSPSFTKKGEPQFAKAKGESIPAFHYRWVEA